MFEQLAILAGIADQQKRVEPISAVQLPKVEMKFRAGVLLDVTPLLCRAIDRTGGGRCK